MIDLTIDPDARRQAFLVDGQHVTNRTGLYRWRKALGDLTIDAAAQKLGISPRTYWEYEAGRKPARTTLQRMQELLAEALSAQGPALVEPEGKTP